MWNKDSFLYELRLSLGWFFWVPLAIVPILALVTYLLWQDQATTPRNLLGILEIWLPMLSGLMVAPLMSKEVEADFHELRISYPEPALRVPVLRALLSIVFASILWVIAFISFRISFGPFDLSLILIPIAPAFYIIGLTLLVANASQNFVIAGTVPVLYCLLESQTSGWITGPIFLFNGFLPNQTPLAINRSLLAFLGCAFLTLNAAISLQKKRP